MIQASAAFSFAGCAPGSPGICQTGEETECVHIGNDHCTKEITYEIIILFPFRRIWHENNLIWKKGTYFGYGYRD